MLELNQVYQGDCLEVMQEIDDNSIDLVVTDPPYGINYKSNRQLLSTKNGVTYKSRDHHYFGKIDNDDYINPKWFSEIFRVLKTGCALYCFCSWKTYAIFESVIIEAGFKIKNMIVLNKSNHGMGDLAGSYANKHELLIFAAKGRHVLNQKEGRLKDVWDVKVKFTRAHRYHPTEKHIDWLITPITESSSGGSVVLDPFAGSGTTGVACQNLNRNYILIEKEPEYVEICKQRLAENGTEN